MRKTAFDSMGGLTGFSTQTSELCYHLVSFVGRVCVTYVYRVPDQGAIGRRLVLLSRSFDLYVGVTLDGRSSIVSFLDKQDIQNHIEEDDQLYETVAQTQFPVTDLDKFDGSEVDQGCHKGWTGLFDTHFAGSSGRRKGEEVFDGKRENTRECLN